MACIQTTITISDRVLSHFKLILITVPEPSTATMESTQVSETTLLVPAPSPTGLPGEFMRSPGH